MDIQWNPTFYSGLGSHQVKAWRKTEWPLPHAAVVILFIRLTPLAIQNTLILVIGTVRCTGIEQPGMHARLFLFGGLVEDLYREIAWQYDTGYSGPLEHAEDRFVLACLRDTGALNGQVLDVGCGTGWLLDNVPELAKHPSYYRCYTGIDISPDMLRVARAKHPAARLVEADMHQPLPDVPPGLYDSALCLYGVLNYSPTPHAVLANLRKAVRFGGRIAVVAYAPGRLAVDGKPVPNDHIAQCSPPFTWQAFNRMMDEVGPSDVQYSISGPLARRMPRLFDVDADLTTLLMPDRGAYFLDVRCNTYKVW